MEFGIGDRVTVLESQNHDHAGKEATIALATPYSSGTVYTLKFADGTKEMAKAKQLQRLEGTEKVILCSICGDPGIADNPIEFKKDGSPIHHGCKEEEEPAAEETVTIPPHWICLQCEKTYTDEQHKEFGGKCEKCRIPLQQTPELKAPRNIFPPLKLSASDKAMLELHQQMRIELFLETPDGEYLLKGRLVVEDFQKTSERSKADGKGDAKNTRPS